MNYDGKTLEKILRMTQKQLKSYLESLLQESGYRAINRKGFLYAPGDVPVLLIAHLDNAYTPKGRKSSAFPRMAGLSCLPRESAEMTAAACL